MQTLSGKCAGVQIDSRATEEWRWQFSTAVFLTFLSRLSLYHTLCFLLSFPPPRSLSSSCLRPASSSVLLLFARAVKAGSRCWQTTTCRFIRWPKPMRACTAAKPASRPVARSTLWTLPWWWMVSYILSQHWKISNNTVQCLKVETVAVLCPLSRIFKKNIQTFSSLSTNLASFSHQLFADIEQ